MEPERLTSKQLKLFQTFIYRVSGIRIDDSKVTLVSNRIRRRLRACKIDDFDSYYKLLTSNDGASELEHFVDAITTNETSFFRTSTHFDWFRGDFLDEVAGHESSEGKPKSLRIWSAACSTGEEAYSLAICLRKASQKTLNMSLQIVGTDISEQVLKLARAGIYGPRAMEGVDESCRKRFFTQLENKSHWQIKKTVREIVSFKHHNLMEPMSGPPFDCIFLRNVLIYFDKASKQVVIDHLQRSLVAGGYLVIGPSEGVYDMLAPLQKISTFLYRKLP